MKRFKIWGVGNTLSDFSTIRVSYAKGNFISRIEYLIRLFVIK